MGEVYTRIEYPDRLRKNILELSLKLTELEKDFNNINLTSKKKEMTKLKKVLDRSKRDFDVFEGMMPSTEKEKKVEINKKEKPSSMDKEIARLQRKLKEI